MPTIGNEGLPGFSPDSDGVFGGGTTGIADFRFLVTFKCSMAVELASEPRNSHDAPVFRIDPDLALNQILCSSSGSNSKPIILPTITKLLTEVAEAVIRRQNVHLPLGRLGVSLILRFEDIVAHSLSYEPGTFGAQYLGLDSIRPTKCCPYFKRCVFFKSRICGMEVPLCRYSIRYRSCHSSWTFMWPKIWSTLGGFSC